MFKRLPIGILTIGCISLLINISSIIVYSLTPIYLTTVFGLSALNLGVVEGLVEILAWSSRIFSGLIADYFHKRKPLLLIAFIIITLTRPLFAITNTISLFFVARSLDRIANGIQATPREALVGDLAPPDLKGASYGFRQSMSVIGSLLGGVITLIALDKYGVKFSSLFWFAAFPPMFAILLLYLFVKETPQKGNESKRTPFMEPVKQLIKSNRRFWGIILVAAVYMLSNYSGFFAIIHAKNITGSNAIAPLIMIFQNIGTMVAAYPVGYWSDKFDRDYLLGLGFVAAIISNYIFSIATTGTELIIAATIWGIQMGVTQSLFDAKIADITGKNVRGSAFGIYYIIVGTMIFCSNTMIGWGFDNLTQGIAFYISSSFALFAIFILLIQKLLYLKKKLFNN